MADVNGNASVPFNLTSSYATNGNYSCTGGISPLSGPLGALSGPGTLSFAGVTSQQPHSCTVTSLTGAGGTSTNPCAASVTLVPPASCTISFSPASATIAADGTATATVGWGSSASTASGTYSCTGTIAPISGALVPLSWGPGPMTFSGASPGSATCTITPKNALDQAGIPCSASVTLLPPAPTVVTLTISPATVSPGQLVSATWSGNNSPTSYTLRQTAPPPAATVYQGPATSLQTAAPATAVTYTYTVQACNAAGCSQESPPATLTVINEPPPGTPVWRIKDSLGPILTIDSLGNAFLVPTSQVNFNTAPPAGLTGAFLLKRNAERVFAFSRNVTYLKGSVRPGQTGLTAGSGKLAIKNGSGQIVAVFDGASGNLYLRGAAVGGM
ncbi:MAG: hypothetical protein HYY58_00565 [Candidatus Omnitrophica bacterium]|nr:hypothetical protein [Candidatus Omnitrophota bacterium]